MSMSARKADIIDAQDDDLRTQERAEIFQVGDPFGEPRCRDGCVEDLNVAARGDAELAGPRLRVLQVEPEREGIAEH